MAGNEVPFSDSLKTQGNMQQTLPLQNATKADVSDKQTLLAVLQFLKKNNLKVWTLIITHRAVRISFVVYCRIQVKTIRRRALMLFMFCYLREQRNYSREKLPSKMTTCDHQPLHSQKLMYLMLWLHTKGRSTRMLMQLYRLANKKIPCLCPDPTYVFFYDEMSHLPLVRIFQLSRIVLFTIVADY